VVRTDGKVLSKNSPLSDVYFGESITGEEGGGEYEGRQAWRWRLGLDERRADRFPSPPQNLILTPSSVAAEPERWGRLSRHDQANKNVGRGEKRGGRKA